MSDRPDVAAAIAAAARTMHQHLAVEDTLLLIADTARSSIPGFDHAGISTIDRHGTIVTRAATGQVVWDLDRIQYGLNQGPCVDALHDQQFVATSAGRSTSRRRPGSVSARSWR